MTLLRLFAFLTNGLVIGFVLGTSPALANSRIEYQDGLLTLQAHQTSFNDLMQALASETGIQVTIFGDNSGPVTVDIQQEPLDTALGKLAPNHMLVKSSDAEDAPVTEIVIMLDENSNSGSGVASEFLPTGAPVQEVIVDEQPAAEQSVSEAQAIATKPRDPAQDPATQATEDANIPQQ